MKRSELISIIKEEVKKLNEAVHIDVAFALRDIKKYNKGNQTKSDFNKLIISIVKNLGFLANPHNLSVTIDHLGASKSNGQIPEDADMVKELYQFLR